MSMKAFELNLIWDQMDQCMLACLYVCVFPLWTCLNCP